ncbi:izumo sperm-egg fusion protein 1 isoform X2 [Paralichthys olivaceus]|uniref:izumo sperm-egg fusion protein 1 isoform X2 n=1 Tax=Paralichthys olivaceus TaxID=8255 RepID=UPI00374FFF67
MLLILVTLLGCVLAADACLQCDRRVRLLHEDLALSAPTVADQIEMTKICDHAYVTYRDTSRERKGVIDHTTLYRASTEYQSEFDDFLKTQHSGSVTFEAIQIMEKGRRILETHLDTFIRDGLCPNMCGLLNRRVMDCFSCRYKIYVCVSPSGQQECGVVPLPDEPHQSPATLPTLPPGDEHSSFQPTEDLLVALIATVTALSLAASVGLIVILGMLMKQRGSCKGGGRRGKTTQSTA